MLQALEEPAPYLERLLALTDHPAPGVVHEVWTTIARIKTPEALAHIFALADSDPAEDLWHIAACRILNDANPAAQARAMNMIREDGAPIAVDDAPAGRQLLWQGWRRFQNQACVDRLAYFGDRRVIEPVVEILLDPATPIRRRVFLANMADGLDDPRVVQAIRNAAERGLLDRKAAIRTLAHLGAHHHAEALAVGEASTHDTDADITEE